jgi:hypothetical protein
MPTTKFTIGTTAKLLVPNQTPELIDCLLQNLSGNDIYIGSSADVTSDNGIKLNANGGVYENDKRLEPIWVIATAAGSDLRVFVEKYINVNIERVVTNAAAY